MSKFCSICRNTDCNNHGKNITFYGDNWECKYIPVPTNADRIRAMSNEELANLLTDYSNNGGWVTEIGRKICYERIFKWLQYPAEEDDHEND